MASGLFFRPCVARLRSRDTDRVAFLHLLRPVLAMPNFQHGSNCIILRSIPLFFLEHARLAHALLFMALYVNLARELKTENRLMIQAIFVGRHRDAFRTLERKLTSERADITWAGTGKKALDLLMDQSGGNGSQFGLVVAGEALADMDARKLVEQVVMYNPMVHCVVASGLSPKDFHELYEGLGVLMQLPPSPGEEAAAGLMERLEKVMGLERMQSA